MPCKITELWEYLAPCTLGVQASGSCLGRKMLSSSLRTKEELLPQHRLFTCSYSLGICVGLQAPLLMGLCWITAVFSLLKGQVLKIIRGQCVVRRQQQASVFWDTYSSQEAFLFNEMTGVLECVVQVVCWGLIVMGSWLKVCVTETCVSQHWKRRYLLIAGSGREKFLKSLGCGGLHH